MEGKLFEDGVFFVLPTVNFNNSVLFFFDSQVEIIAKDYLSSLTEPKEEPENKESSDTEENGVRF